MTENKHKQQVVISMTSFPAAIPFAEDAVRSLLNGSVLPDKLILYVTLSRRTPYSRYATTTATYAPTAS